MDIPNEKLSANSNKFRIAGWSFSTLGNPITVEIFIDEKKMLEIKTGTKRPDLAKAYLDNEYAGTSGFDTIIDISEVADGIHYLKVFSKSNNIKKLLGRETKIELPHNRFNKCKISYDNPLIQKNETLIGDILLPFDRDVIKNNEIIVKGWNFSILPQKVIVSFLIDEKKVAETTPDIELPEVQNLYREFEGSLKSGFLTKINLGNLKDGDHILKIISNANNVEKLLGTINFVLKRS